MSRTPEYKIWDAMRTRCTNPNHPQWDDYGGRGIEICDEWANSFTAFITDVGRRPYAKAQIDRIDNDGHYEPGNVRWITRQENMNNMRTNRHVTYGGSTHTISEWSRRTGINKATIGARIDMGWTLEEVFTRPVQRGSRSK